MNARSNIRNRSLFCFSENIVLENFIFNKVPLAHCLAGMAAADFKTAVGPLTSIPARGEIPPSAKGLLAFRPSQEAPTPAPIGT